MRLVLDVQAVAGLLLQALLRGLRAKVGESGDGRETPSSSSAPGPTEPSPLVGGGLIRLPRTFPDPSEMTVMAWPQQPLCTV